jgi:isoaspartyl peptidase/L-asparaginase-like protein (Ntn-hydrolase superfamily)
VQVEHKAHIKASILLLEIRLPLMVAVMVMEKEHQVLPADQAQVKLALQQAMLVARQIKVWAELCDMEILAVVTIQLTIRAQAVAV